MTEGEMVGWHHNSMDMSLSRFREVVDREAWSAAVHGVAKRHNLATEQQFYTGSNLVCMLSCFSHV